MRRLLIAGFASLLAVALITPGAQGATGVKTLTLEGQFAGVPTAPVQMKIDYLVEHRNGHKRLIPNRVTHFDYAFPGLVSCDQGSTLVGVRSVLTSTSRSRRSASPPPTRSPLRPYRAR